MNNQQLVLLSRILAQRSAESPREIFASGHSVTYTPTHQPAHGHVCTYVAGSGLSSGGLSAKIFPMPHTLGTLS